MHVGTKHIPLIDISFKAKIYHSKQEDKIKHISRHHKINLANNLTSYSVSPFWEAQIIS
jgi:hypothetical protein